MKKYIDRQIAQPTPLTNEPMLQNPSDVLTSALSNNQLPQDPSAEVPNTQNTVDRRMASPPTPAAAQGPLHPSIVVPNSRGTMFPALSTPPRPIAAHGPLHPSIMVPHSQGTVDPAPSLLPRPVVAQGPLHPSIMVPHSQGTVDPAPSLQPRPIAVAAQVRTDASLMEIRLTEAVAPSDQSSTHHPATSAPPPTAANPEETIWRVTGVRATETVAPAHGSSQLRYKFNEKDLVMRTKNIVFQPRTMYPMSSQHRPYCLVLSVKPLRDGSSVRGVDATNTNIRGIFGKLGFRVIFVVDPTAEQIQTYLAQLGKRNDHSAMVVVFLAGPFNTNEIIGSDGQPFNVDHIFRLLGTAQSLNLANKPKLLFLDTVSTIRPMDSFDASANR